MGRSSDLESRIESLFCFTYVDEKVRLVDLCGTSPILPDICFKRTLGGENFSLGVWKNLDLNPSNM